MIIILANIRKQPPTVVSYDTLRQDAISTYTWMVIALSVYVCMTTLDYIEYVQEGSILYLMINFYILGRMLCYYQMGVYNQIIHIRRYMITTSIILALTMMV